MRTFAAQMLHLVNVNTGLTAMANGSTDPFGKVSAENSVAQTKEATTKDRNV